VVANHVCDQRPVDVVLPFIDRLLFGVWGSGFRVQSSGLRVQGSGFRVQGLGFRVQGSGFRVQGAVFFHSLSVSCLGSMG